MIAYMYASYIFYLEYVTLLKNNQTGCIYIFYFCSNKIGIAEMKYAKFSS